MGERSRWTEIEAVCQAALDRRPDERRAFVATTCGDDEELRCEVESLLAHAESDAAFLESPLAAVAAHALGADENALTGSRVGSLEIGPVIGRGGMGEVYRARDTRLERDVAVKVLPAVFAQDPDRLARFKREALILASLNHPNIAAIYGLEDLGDAQALVLELVEGPTLEERLRESALSVDDTVSVARQIAEALEAAHERGVVHRDLKPANVKLRPDGVVKVLDFGLATAFDSVDGPGASDQRDTPSSSAAAGDILGTPRYMSPEQRAGQTTDKRSDIWAFGAILYEMLAGRPPFGAQPSAETAAVPESIDWSALRHDTPDALQRLIARCLERNPRQRLRDIGEARIALDREDLEPSAGFVVPPQKKRPFWRRAIPVTVAAVAAAGLTAAVTWRLKPSPTAAVARLTVPLPDGQALARATGRHAIAIAPDGGQIVYAGIPAALYQRDLSQSDPIVIKGSEGFGRVSEPTFSPDGRSIAFHADGAIRTIPVTGGSASTLVSAEPPYGMSWGRDGIVLGQGAKGVARASANHGTEVLVRVEDGEEAHGPQVLPGGRHVMFTLASGTSSDRWDRARIVVQSLSTGERVSIVEGGSDARYLPTGHVLYARKGVLYLVAFDADRVTTRGTPWPALENVAQATGGQTGAVDAAVSDNGVIVYVGARPASTWSDGAFHLGLTDRRGETTLLGLPADSYQSPRLSPDGTRVAFATDDGAESVIWVWDVSGKTGRQRLTFAGNSRFPAWSSDSRRIVFQSDRDGDHGMFVQAADGSGSRERLTTSTPGVAHVPQSWSPTDPVLLFTVTQAARVSLWTLSLKDKQATVFPHVPLADSISAAFSPDGKWVAYGTGAPGSLQLRVQPFPPTGAIYQLAPGNATPSHPLWSRRGDEIFFNPGLRGGLGVVTVTRAPNFAFTTPVMLPRPFALSPPEQPRAYDVTDDGRFLARVPADQSLSAARVGARMHVVLNWFDELRAAGSAGR